MKVEENENGAEGSAHLSLPQFVESKTKIDPDLTTFDFRSRTEYEAFVFILIKERVPDADANISAWRKLLSWEARANSPSLYLVEALEKFDAAVDQGVEIANPGGWITKVWKDLAGV